MASQLGVGQHYQASGFIIGASPVDDYNNFVLDHFMAHSLASSM